MKRSLFEQDHDAFRESAREFVTRTIRPREEELAEQRFIDRDIWLEAGRNGFLGLEVPEEYGGSGADDYRFNAVLGEELARSSAAVASCFGIHIDIVAPYLVKLTTEEQKKRWLPGFCSGHPDDAGEEGQGHNALRRRKRDRGFLARTQARQGRPTGIRYRRAVLRERAGAQLQHDR